MKNLADDLYLDFEKKLSEAYQKQIIQFFLTFMRFEFVLKYKYFEADAKTAWKEFVEHNQDIYNITERTNKYPQLKEAVCFLRDQPPQKLSYKKDNFEWSNVARNSKGLELLTLLVKAVRNNLFHGNKSIGSDNGRDCKLLGASTLVISDWILFLDAESDFMEELF